MTIVIFEVNQMNTVSKSKLKANMLQIFREIEITGEILIVTDHNKPVLKITPIKQGESVEDVFGALQGQIVFHEDPDAPTIDEWEEV